MFCSSFLEPTSLTTVSPTLLRFWGLCGSVTPPTFLFLLFLFLPSVVFWFFFFFSRHPTPAPQSTVAPTCSVPPWIPFSPWRQTPRKPMTPPTHALMVPPPPHSTHPNVSSPLRDTHNPPKRMFDPLTPPRLCAPILNLKSRLCSRPCHTPMTSPCVFFHRCLLPPSPTQALKSNTFHSTS